MRAPTIDDASDGAAAPATGRPWWLRLVTRPVTAGLLLLAAYCLLSLAMDPHAYLGTDTGGKVVTLDAMEANGTTRADVGYWAEQWDPDGRVHPLWYTARIGDQWVQLSTLPMTYAARPLYELGGYRLALLLPIAGGVAAAFAARALARRSGNDEWAWAAYWLVGLASPMVIYALDFWEHTIGVAFMAWGLVALLAAMDQPRWPHRVIYGVLGGLALGSATTMRTEAFAYAAVTIAVPCVILLVGRRRPLAAVVTGASAAAGLIPPILANAALERAVLGSVLRAGRAATTAGAPGLGGSTVRLQEAVLMAGSPFPALDASSLMLGVALVALLVFVALRSAGRGDQRPAQVAAVVAVVVYVLRLADGPGFVPGLVAATPIAAVGLGLAYRRPSSRAPYAVALLSLPLVWLFHSLGGAAPQWAGRYILTTGLVLMALGVVELSALRRWSRRLFVGLAIAVTVFGLVWMSIRTHQMAAAQQVLADRPEPVLVSGVAHLVREGGAYARDHRWLTAQGTTDQLYAADVLARAGERQFGLVQLADGEAAPQLPGWTISGSQTVPLFNGIDLRVTTYQR